MARADAAGAAFVFGFRLGAVLGAGFGAAVVEDRRVFEAEAVLPCRVSVGGVGAAAAV